MKITIHVMNIGQIMKEYITQTKTLNLSKFNIY